MELTAISEMMPSRRQLLKLARRIPVPSVVMPVSVWGVRGLRPRSIRDAASGALALGVLSLAIWGVNQFVARRRVVPTARHTKPPEGQRWKLPIHGPIMAEEMLCSAASGH